jgi:hypothetical protein
MPRAKFAAMLENFQLRVDDIGGPEPWRTIVHEPAAKDQAPYWETFSSRTKEIAMRDAVNYAERRMGNFRLGGLKARWNDESIEADALWDRRLADMGYQPPPGYVSPIPVN